MEAIRYSSEGLTIINQLLLPQRLEYKRINCCDDAWHAIRNMEVRGAPAIAIVGGLSLALELKERSFNSFECLSLFVKEKLNELCASRPTATNMLNLSLQINKFVNDNKFSLITPEDLKQSVIHELEKYRIDDIACNKSIGYHGFEALKKLYSEKMTILTHCNTGALATSGFGTALGVVRKVHENDMLDRCYFTETRPYNQGARLTAYELHHDAIPCTLICDSMVGTLMANKTVSAVITGADCVAANGDTANKVGTYQIAVLAKHHNIPFFIAAPLSSINLNIACGASIIIEERPPEELTKIAGINISVDGINCWNPSFDVTPHQLIAGIITEHGVFDVSTLRENVQAHSPCRGEH